MPKTLRLTVALPLALLALVAGCSPSDSLNVTAASAQSESSQPPDSKADAAKKLKTPSLLPPGNPDPEINAQVQKFISGIAAGGFSKENQGVWIQTGNTFLADYRGTVPLPAASVTKSATTLAALQTFGPDHQFVTQIGATGPIQNGVLQGDLVIQGGEDPFFVWEEAIAAGNILNQAGVKRVTGNLVIVGKFYMNFESDPLTAGNLLKQGIDSEIWPEEAKTQYQSLPPGTARPAVAIEGAVKVMPSPPDKVQPLVRHFSLPLAELLKKMNMYSNNMMAQMLADAAGGAPVVAKKVAEAAGVPPAEIQLINGSGLGEENRISPRAAVAIFQAIELYLQPYNMTVADVFAIAGKDLGVLKERKIPTLSVVKTGTLDRVASIAGAMPTQKQGPVWVAIMNGGENLEGFRAQQDVLLNSLLSRWGAVPSAPAELSPSPARIGKSSRSEIVK